MAPVVHDRFEVKLVLPPGWALLLTTAAGILIVALAAVVGFGSLLLMLPIIVGVGAAQGLRNRRSGVPAPPRRWPPLPISTPPSDPIVIDGEYEVINDDTRRAKETGLRDEK